MTTQMIRNSTKWALEYLFSKKNFKNKKLAKQNIYFRFNIFFTLRKKTKKNLNANSMKYPIYEMSCIYNVFYKISYL